MPDTLRKNLAQAKSSNEELHEANTRIDTMELQYNTMKQRLKDAQAITTKTQQQCQNALQELDVMRQKIREMQQWHEANSQTFICVATRTLPFFLFGGPVMPACVVQQARAV
ncbi:hypothetical protein FQN50_009574 [Emmonsiellopsis sp. PD_5]|nr:hypothetical protein FQN50_009574 [Emmonsiellopsis sp. PD_5]